MLHLHTDRISAMLLTAHGKARGCVFSTLGAVTRFLALWSKDAIDLTLAGWNLECMPLLLLLLLLLCCVRGNTTTRVYTFGTQ